MKKYFDWQGNLIEDGIIIYLVQTKPMFSNCRFGMLIPHGDGKSETIMESDEDYKTRTEQKLWELGEPLQVVKRTDGGFNLIREHEGYTLASPIEWSVGEETTVAIKGVSDTNEQYGLYEDTKKREEIKRNQWFGMK